MNEGGYQVIKMGEGFWRIVDGMIINYLVEGGERSALIDAGISGGDLLGAARSVTDKPVSLICTHADHDHVASAPQFAEVYLHPAEFERFSQQNISPIPPVRPLWDNDDFELGGRALTIIHIPGHTPGSVALLDKKARFLISGDSVSDHGVWMFGSGRCFAAYQCSIERLIKMSDRFDVIHSAHGSPSIPIDLLQETLEASRLLLAGKLEGTQRSENETQKFYKSGRTGFMY